LELARRSNHPITKEDDAMAQRDLNSDPLSSTPPGNTAQQAKNEAKGFVDQATEQAKNLASQTKDQVKSLADQAKEETSKVAGQARGQVEGLVAQQKDRMADQLGHLAGALRDAGSKLDEKDVGIVRYAGRAADQVERVSGYLREHQLGDVIRDAEAFARRRPEVFLGGTFLAGLVLARFLKASGEQDGETGRPQTGASRRPGEMSRRTGENLSRPADRSYTAPRPYTPAVGG